MPCSRGKIEDRGNKDSSSKGSLIKERIYMEQMIVTIKNGNVEIEVEGVKGSRCLELTQAIEQIIGEVETRSLKPEIYCYNKIRQNTLIELIDK